MMRSALYVGSVVHRRFRPKPHQFRYGVFWLLVDLADLGAISSRLRLFSYNRTNLFSIRDRDHGDGSETRLRTQIENLLHREGIDIEDGRILLLCMPRMLGHCFNPLSVYFCSRADGELAAIVYEVHNTFGERHSYVLATKNSARPARQSCNKAFYVSPFLDMDLRYEFRAAVPDSRLSLTIHAEQSGETVLFAGMTGKRRALNDRALASRLLLSPWITLKVVFAIHFEAARLWAKGLRVRPHAPKREHLAPLAAAGD